MQRGLISAHMERITVVQPWCHESVDGSSSAFGAAFTDKKDFLQQNQKTSRITRFHSDWKYWKV